MAAQAAGRRCTAAVTRWRGRSRMSWGRRTTWNAPMATNAVRRCSATTVTWRAATGMSRRRCAGWDAAVAGNARAHIPATAATPVAWRRSAGRDSAVTRHAGRVGQANSVVRRRRAGRDVRAVAGRTGAAGQDPKLTSVTAAAGTFERAGPSEIAIAVVVRLVTLQTILNGCRGVMLPGQGTRRHRSIMAAVA